MTIKKIAINSGHFSTLDPGACGRYSCEADLVKDVAKVVCEDLKLVGYDVLFIEENELQDIVNQSDEFEADVFVSIHANAAENKQAEGTETFYYYGSGFGYILAKCLQHQLLTTMHSVNRGIKEAGFYVLKCNAIAALVELDFISNPAREDYLNTHVEEMAHAISRGITDFVEEVSDQWM